MSSERYATPRTATPDATSGSATVTSTIAGPSEPSSSGPILRLRATDNGQTESRRIQWAEDVIDNEGMGKKSSKGINLSHTALSQHYLHSDSF